MHVVKCEILGETFERKNFQVLRVVGRFRFAVARAGEYDCDGMMPRVPLRIGICMELLNVFNVEACFFASFPQSGCFECLTVIDESSGKAHP